MRHLLCLAVLLVGSIGLAAPPELKIPVGVTGEVGDFIPVVVDTEGKQVKFVALTPGLKVFPSGFLNNPKSTVVSAKEVGQYKLLAYTASATGEVSDPVTILVTVTQGTAPPLPVVPDNMDQTNPILKDPLYATVKDTYKSLNVTDKGKRVALAAVYRATADAVKDVDNVGNLFRIIHEASDKRLGAGGMQPIRELFGGELQNILPKVPSQALTKENKDDTAKQLRRFASILEAVK